MSADDHRAKAEKLRKKARWHGGLFGRGTRKRLLQEAQLQATYALDKQLGQQQTAPPPALPPAGWYPDPDESSRQRWWDGSKWTEHRSETAS